MITYVDTSTILKLVIDEHGSDRAETIWRSSESLASVTLIIAEGRAALAAAARSDRLTPDQHLEARAAFDGLVESLYLIAVDRLLVDHAASLAEEEALRGYDAVHLAAALRVDATVMTSADSDMCDAAARRGMHVANPVHR